MVGDVCRSPGAAGSEGLGKGFGPGFEGREGRAVDGRGRNRDFGLNFICVGEDECWEREIRVQW